MSKHDHVYFPAIVTVIMEKAGLYMVLAFVALVVGIPMGFVDLWWYPIIYLVFALAALSTCVLAVRQASRLVRMERKADRPVRTPCCDKPINGRKPSGDLEPGWPIAYNPYNGVVQCHACGAVYIPDLEAAPPGEMGRGVALWTEHGGGLSTISRRSTQTQTTEDSSPEKERADTMGDRANIVVTGPDNYGPIYLYAHHWGGRTPKATQRALRLSKGVGLDTHYLARVLLDELKGSDPHPLAGYGIALHEAPDRSRPTIWVDDAANQVRVLGEDSPGGIHERQPIATFSYAEFCALDLSEVRWAEDWQALVAT